MADSPRLIEHRRRGRPAALVLLHGFGGDAATTWGAFPTLLGADPLLDNWDIYSVGYSTSLSFDIAGIWSADPQIITIGGLLETLTDVDPLGKYAGLAFFAHSMGGLVLQRALLTNRTLRSRVSHVALFGTPSGGLEKASPFRFWKRQIRDMAQGSTFISGLRTEWTSDIGTNPPFTFVSIAGDRDEFVPTTSSLDPFPKAHHRVVYGNHLQIVKPEDREHLGYKVALKLLTDGVEALGQFDSALRAVESREFQQAIDVLWPRRDQLDDQGLVTLALALESVQRQGDAIELLSKAMAIGTDPLGVLAGRLKRRWLVERRRVDAEQALSRYREGLEHAEAKNDAPQAFYHAINCAFMNLAFGSDINAARELATKALGYCAQSGRQDIWRYATEGEAYLYLDDPVTALQAYEQAIALRPKPREVASMYQQAVRAADLMGTELYGDAVLEDEDAFIKRLAATFGQVAAAV